MRVRLLIDVNWPDKRLPELQEIVAEQHLIFTLIPDMATPNEFPGRLMGAQPVEADKTAG